MTFAGRTIAELAALPLLEMANSAYRCTAIRRPRASSPRICSPASRPVTELGLGYLSLDRATPTLSAGELQRLRLATQLRSGLFGVVYVLDEPSAGLHPADTEALLAVLDRLKSAGNSVFVVEHHLDVMRGADWLVDVGPRAGEHGGQVLHSGPVAALERVTESATAHFLFDRSPAPVREVRPSRSQLKVGPVSRHNLRGVTAEFPLGVVHRGHRCLRFGQVHAHRRRSRRICPVVGRLVTCRPEADRPHARARTWLPTPGLFDVVRKVFAATEEAHRRGYGVGRFSFNVAGGRCETCQGEGFVSVELLFLPSTYAPCPDCGGARYNPADTRSDVPGTEHRAGAGPDGRGGRGLLRGHSGRRPQPRAPCSTSASAICGSASRRPNCPAARPSASSSRANSSVPAGATRSTFSTSRRPDCIRPMSRS